MPWSSNGWSAARAAGFPTWKTVVVGGVGRRGVRKQWYWHQAADFYLIAGNVEKAIGALEVGIQALLSQDFSYSDKAQSSHSITQNDATMGAFWSNC